MVSLLIVSSIARRPRPIVLDNSILIEIFYDTFDCMIAFD